MSGCVLMHTPTRSPIPSGSSTAAMLGVYTYTELMLQFFIKKNSALLLAIDMAQHLIRWARSPSHQGMPGNERADTLAEKGRQDHPLLRYPSPDKRGMSHTPSPAAPVKGRT